VWAPPRDSELRLPNSPLRWPDPATSPSCPFSEDWQLRLAPAIALVMANGFAEAQIVTVFAVVKF